MVYIKHALSDFRLDNRSILNYNFTCSKSNTKVREVITYEKQFLEHAQRS